VVACAGLGSLLQPELVVDYALGSAGRGEAAKSQGETREGTSVGSFTEGKEGTGGRLRVKEGICVGCWTLMERGLNPWWVCSKKGLLDLLLIFKEEERITELERGGGRERKEREKK